MNRAFFGSALATLLGARESDAVARLTLKAVAVPPLRSGLLPSVMAAVRGSWPRPEKGRKREGCECNAAQCRAPPDDGTQYAYA